MLPKWSSMPFLSLGLLKYICSLKDVAKIALTSWGHLLWELQRKKFTTFEDILLLFMKLIGAFLGICICLEWPGIDIDLLPSRWVLFSVIAWSAKWLKLATKGVGGDNPKKLWSAKTMSAIVNVYSAKLAQIDNEEWWKWHSQRIAGEQKQCESDNWNRYKKMLTLPLQK